MGELHPLTGHGRYLFPWLPRPSSPTPRAGHSARPMTTLASPAEVNRRDLLALVPRLARDEQPRLPIHHTTTVCSGLSSFELGLPAAGDFHPVSCSHRVCAYACRSPCAWWMPARAVCRRGRRRPGRLFGYRSPPSTHPRQEPIHNDALSKRPGGSGARRWRRVQPAHRAQKESQ